MTSTLISVAVQTVRTILHLTEMYKLQDARMQELTDRVISLEQPLVILENRPYHAISEQALQKLIDTLEDVQKMIERHNKTTMKAKTKRFILGDANMYKIQHINERLDSSLLDLQLAMQVEQSEKEEKRSGITAQTTVDLLLTNVNQRAKETILLCVQCNQEYRQSENAEGSCKYHTANPMYHNWNYKLNCCDKLVKEWDEINKDTAGCVRGVHSSVHHFDYPYTACFVWMRGELRTNVKETFLRVEDPDFEDEIPKYAMFGATNNHKLFVAVGKGNFPLYLEYFSRELPIYAPEDPAEITGGNLWQIATRGTDNLPSILDKSEQVGSKWEASAHWLIDFRSKCVNGIRLTAKSLSSKGPTMKSMNFTYEPFTPGKPVLVSSPLYNANISYTHALPPVTTNFTPFPDSIFQEAPLEPEFETVIKGNMKMRLKKVGKCRANPNSSGYHFDTYEIELLVMNLAAPHQQGSSSEERMVVLSLLKEGKIAVEEALKLLGALDASPHSDGPHTIIEATARAYIDGKWLDAQNVKIVPGNKDTDENRAHAIPFNVAPRNASKLIVTAQFAAPGKSGGGWIGRSYGARLGPAIIELTLEEMGGSKATLQSQYANGPAYFGSGPKPENIYCLSMDSITNWNREMVQILPATKDQEKMIFQISYTSRTLYVSFDSLQSWGYKAWKAKTHLYKIEDASNETVTVTGLVDLVSKTVCGFHFHVKMADESTEGIWMIPDALLQEGRKLSIDPLLLELSTGPVHHPLQQVSPDTVASPQAPHNVWNKVSPSVSSPQSPAQTRGPTLSKPAPVKPAPAVRPPATTSPAVAATPQTRQPAPAPPPRQSEADGYAALICQNCNVMNKDKCVKCNAVEMVPDRRTPASLCKMKCANPGNNLNCVRCGKRT